MLKSGFRLRGFMGELGSAGTLGWEKIRLGEEDPPLFFFFKQKTAYEIMPSLVGSEMCIRDRVYG